MPVTNGINLRAPREGDRDYVKDEVSGDIQERIFFKGKWRDIEEYHQAERNIKMLVKLSAQVDIRGGFQRK